MSKLTKKYSDGSFSVADNLPFGENSHAFKDLLINTLGQYEDFGTIEEVKSNLRWFQNIKNYVRGHMSTHAEIEIKTTSGKTYKFWRHADGYPSGVVGDLINTDELEEMRRALGLEDLYESCPDYYYEIDLGNKYIKVFNSSYVQTKTWNKGELMFEGTFDEARENFKD